MPLKRCSSSHRSRISWDHLSSACRYPIDVRVATVSSKGYQMLLNIYKFVHLIYFVHATINVINFLKIIIIQFLIFDFTRVITLIITHIKLY